MSWQKNDNHPDEDDTDQVIFNNLQINTVLPQEFEQKKVIQLKKFQDPTKNREKQAYITLVTHFETLLLANSIDEMIKTLLTDDCQFFLFSSTGRPPVLYSLQPKGILDLYKGIRVQERRVRESFLDLEKSTVVQISNFKTKYQDEESSVDEVVLEIFTIKNGKISKCRAFFAKITPAHGDGDPFKLSRKDKVLAKLKDLNYALADQPDLDKVASFFNENTQYKIWSWEGQKHFTFGKQNFAANFRSLQENLVLKCIIPFEMYMDAQYAVGTYVYQLEGRSGGYKDKKYVWLTTCVYTFENNLDISKIIQQGELFLEDEIEIPFEVFSRERIIQKLTELHEVINTKPSMDIIYNDQAKISSQVCIFGCETLPGVGLYQGLDKADQVLTDAAKRTSTLEWSRIVDMFVDIEDPAYDVAISICCNQGAINCPGYKYNDKHLNSITILTSYLENGKVVKALFFYCEIPDPIPSPFDDPELQGLNIRKGL